MTIKSLREFARFWFQYFLRLIRQYGIPTNADTTKAKARPYTYTSSSLNLIVITATIRN